MDLLTLDLEFLVKEGNSMDNMEQIEHIDKDMFTHVGKNLEAAQAIKRPSLSYLKDAMRRLRKNKPSIISFWILVVMILMSMIGPIISNKLYGHTYRKQYMEDQNQTSFISNRRSIMMKVNDVFDFEKYNPNLTKTKVAFQGLKLESTGKIAFQIGKEEEESIQGDRKEFILEIEVTGDDNWNTIVEKLNNEGEKLLNEDSDFRGITFKKSGDKLIVETEGERWFNDRYWFGTDQYGRDLFTRLWKGGRVSFIIAFLSVFMTAVIGVIYGGIAGYFGGMIDTIMMRIVEVLMVIPSLLYVILLLTVMNPGFKPIIIVLGVTGWMGTARIVRGEVMRLRNSEYVLAAQTLGAGSKRIIFKHLVTNSMGPIIVNMTMQIPGMIFTEAFLSFIGLGIPIPEASWGSLINEGATIFQVYPNQLFVPAIALSITMLAFNTLGDGLRDALDPKLRT